MGLTTFIQGLTNGGATPALEATMAFVHARHRVIAENVANYGNPNYKTKRLDPGAFQKALSVALKSHTKRSDPFVIPESDQIRSTNGRVEFVPTADQPGNVLFQDGTNMSIERQMSDMAANAMLTEMTATLLDGYYDGTRKAIRGRL